MGGRGDGKWFVLAMLHDAPLTRLSLQGHLRKLLTIQSDLSSIVRQVEGNEGKVFWTCSYNITMKFGGPELTIFASWKEGVSAHRVLFSFNK